ncbi:MAG TPA: hypothetical protein VD860_15785 [Azospirillum sp.]|nr:hypothetical protein [Azospirillum sp.]
MNTISRAAVSVVAAARSPAVVVDVSPPSGADASMAVVSEVPAGSAAGVCCPSAWLLSAVSAVRFVPVVTVGVALGAVGSAGASCSVLATGAVAALVTGASAGCAAVLAASSAAVEDACVSAGAVDAGEPASSAGGALSDGAAGSGEVADGAASAAAASTVAAVAVRAASNTRRGSRTRRSVWRAPGTFLRGRFPTPAPSVLLSNEEGSAVPFGDRSDMHAPSVSFERFGAAFPGSVAAQLICEQQKTSSKEQILYSFETTAANSDEMRHIKGACGFHQASLVQVRQHNALHCARVMWSADHGSIHVPDVSELVRSRAVQAGAGWNATLS